uniref:Uncharacterized protein n=1 Tax=Eutreptiella gymnastica TaxID=73025 RepID=A0A7S1IZG4_9EUGL|mmetsp:Transcript_55853/g.99438  ORF Transcript_55853/g.99438 Transcript_55853/m.99438 type:complete len:105 (+) Transcript_55853:469-783(+)
MDVVVRTWGSNFATCWSIGMDGLWYAPIFWSKEKRSIHQPGPQMQQLAPWAGIANAGAGCLTPCVPTTWMHALLGKPLPLGAASSRKVCMHAMARSSGGLGGAG